MPSGVFPDWDKTASKGHKNLRENLTLSPSQKGYSETLGAEKKKVATEKKKIAPKRVF